MEPLAKCSALGKIGLASNQNVRLYDPHPLLIRFAEVQRRRFSTASGISRKEARHRHSSPAGLTKILVDHRGDPFKVAFCIAHDWYPAAAVQITMTSAEISALMASISTISCGSGEQPHAANRGLHPPRRSSPSRSRGVVPQPACMKPPMGLVDS